MTAIVTGSLVLLPLAFEASAQMRDTQRDTQRSGSDKDKMRTAWNKPADVMESKKLIGARIKGADGKDVGEIDQLMVNQKDGKISHVVIGKGGVAGIGETKVVVPWSDLQVRWDRDTPVVSVDAAALEQAPRYEARAADRDRAPSASPSTTTTPSR
ncbi:MAG: PRC-barrel domain-containing protein [Candidatus Rokuibacteriota bacterium]